MPSSRFRRLMGVATLSLAFAAGEGVAGQPLDEGYRVLKQPPGECAATSTWLMLWHYYRGGQSPQSALPRVCIDDGCAGPGGRSANTAELTEWIQVLKGDTLLPSLRGLERQLRAMRARPSGKRLFQTRGNFDRVGRRGAGAEKRAKRLQEIRRLLDDNKPVIIHMHRPFPFAGHYLTVVGYEAEADGGGTKFAYVDTSHPEDGVAWVEEADLRSEDWYDRAEWAPAAVWNGRYLSFWPNSEGTPPN